MIVRDRPSGFRLFFVLRGSILPQIRGPLLANTLVATIVAVTHGALFHLKITLTTIPFSLIGLALAIFLGFRNTAAYDRYWEARKLWGELVHRSRSLARQCQSLIDMPAPMLASNGLSDVRVRMVYRAIAFVHGLRHMLRDSTDYRELVPLLSEHEAQHLTQTSNPPDWLMQCMGRDLQQCLRQGLLDGCRATALDATLSAMVSAAAGCERIKNTPIPFSYALLLHRTAYLYCFLLPFGLVDSIGFMTPFVVAIIAYTFFGLDALGDEIEEPFGVDPNDLPLESMCRAIEINLREALADEHVPEQIAVVDHCLM